MKFKLDLMLRIIQQPQANDLAVLLELEEGDIKILSLAFELVMNTIQGGFHARIGASREEVKSLLLLVQRSSKIIKHENNKKIQRESQISVEQLRILVQILNEVCNGIFVEDFEVQLGASEEILNTFLRIAGNSYKTIKKTNRGYLY